MWLGAAAVVDGALHGSRPNHGGTIVGCWWRTGAAHRRGSDHVVTEGFGLPGAEQV